MLIFAKFCKCISVCKCKYTFMRMCIIKYTTCHFFFLWMGTQNGHSVPFLESASLKKWKRKAMKRIKQIHKISKNGNKKKSCHLVPKVVIDLPFEGSWKYRRRERVPKAGSRREETITEPINFCIREFHTIVESTIHFWPCKWGLSEWVITLFELCVIDFIMF